MLAHRFKKQPKELDYDRLMRRKPVGVSPEAGVEASFCGPSRTHVTAASLTLTSPTANKMFQEFLNVRAVPASEYGLHKPYNDPLGQLLMQFLGATKELGTAEQDAAFEEVTKIENRFLNHSVIKATWSGNKQVIWGPTSEAREDFEKRKQALKNAGEKAVKAQQSISSGASHMRVTQLSGFFRKFEAEAHEYLSGEPWSKFLDSGHFVRYCQWKQLEINMTVSSMDFDIHRILGKGGFGEVHGCRKRDTGKMFAMKKLDKRRLKLKHSEYSAVHERNVLGEMNSKFVVNLKYVYPGASALVSSGLICMHSTRRYAFHDNETLYLVLDLMEGGDLSFHLKRNEGPFSEPTAMFYAAEITLGLQHIHSRNMVYRDLKPANILLDQHGHCRISDMGLVRDLHRSLPTSECGTRGYMAPEVMQKNMAYGRGADWFSLGCTVLEMLTKTRPFAPKGEDDNVCARTLKGEFSWEGYDAKISLGGQAFVKALLEPNPDKRLGSRSKGRSDPNAVKSHPWFADMDWLALNDHKVKPMIEPLQGQVNAKEVYEIDRFQVGGANPSRQSFTLEPCLLTISILTGYGNTWYQSHHRRRNEVLSPF